MNYHTYCLILVSMMPTQHVGPLIVNAAEQYWHEAGMSTGEVSNTRCKADLLSSAVVQ